LRLRSGLLLRHGRPQGRDHWAVGFLYPFERPAQRLHHHFHMHAARMQHPILRLDDGNMPLPEQQIAPLQAVQIAGVQRIASTLHLHIAVAQARDAGRPQRNLHEPGAVDAKRGFAAPKVRHARKPLGYPDVVLGALPYADEVIGENEAASEDFNEAAFKHADGSHGRGETQLGDGRPPDIRRGIEIGKPCADTVRVLFDHARKAIHRRVSNIAIVVQLDPGPALAEFVDRQQLAAQGLGGKRGVEARCDPDGGRGRGDLAEFALGIARRPNPVLQRSRRQIFAIRIEARIELGHSMGLSNSLRITSNKARMACGSPPSGLAGSARGVQPKMSK
jgi:hypothetical protein